MTYFPASGSDAGDALGVVKRLFGLSRMETCELERGLEYIGDRETYSGMVRERMGLRETPVSAE